MAYVFCVRACVWELWVLVHVPDLCLGVRLKGDVRQSTLCMDCLRSHHFYCVYEYVLSCPVSVLVFFWGGCELVCVCSRERGGFLFGVGWVFLLFINTWVWCHVQVCVQLHDALICISMPAWPYFFLSFTHTGAHHFWEVCDGCFLVVFAGPCSPFASLSSCLILLGPGCCCLLLGQSQPSGVVGLKQHQYDSHYRT